MPRRFMLMKRWSDSAPESSARRARSRYYWTAAMAASPMGTARSLDPLPITVRKPRSRFRSAILSPTSSLTRSPVAYRSSSMALSRRPTGVLGSGPSSSASTSTRESVFGRRFHPRGVSRFDVGSVVARPSMRRYLWNPLIADRHRATDGAAMPALDRPVRKETMSDSLMSSGPPALISSRYLRRSRSYDWTVLYARPFSTVR